MPQASSKELCALTAATIIDDSQSTANTVMIYDFNETKKKRKTPRVVETKSKILHSRSSWDLQTFRVSRTHNLQVRSLTRYPLRQRTTLQATSFFEEFGNKTVVRWDMG